MEENIIQKLENLENKIDSLNVNTREILTLDEAVNYLKISRSYLYKLTSSKEIPHYKPSGKLIYFKKEELDSWLLENKVNSHSEVTENLILDLSRKRNGRRI